MHLILQETALTRNYQLVQTAFGDAAVSQE
jgi:hypothetical protein